MKLEELQRVYNFLWMLNNYWETRMQARAFEEFYCYTDTDDEWNVSCTMPCNLQILHGFCSTVLDTHSSSAAEQPANVIKGFVEVK